MHTTIKVSRIYCFSMIIIGLLLTNFTPFIGLICIILGVLSMIPRIEILNKDAKYFGILRRTSIKDIESIDTLGIGIFNRVSIYGRGRQKITLSAIGSFAKIRKIVENIENLK